MPEEDELLYRRRILGTAVTEITAVAREVRLAGGDPRPYLEEALRVAQKLWKIQKQIEKYDLD